MNKSTAAAAVISVVLLAYIVGRNHLYSNPNLYTEDKIDGIIFNPSSRILTIPTPDDRFTHLNLGVHLDHAQNCDQTYTSSENNQHVYRWFSGSNLTISRLQPQDEAKCIRITWQVRNVEDTPSNWPKDCFSFREGYWYGAGEVYYQHWPLDISPYPMQPFITTDFLQFPGQPLYGPVSERYFLNSKGYAFVVDESTPLWVSKNEEEDGRICLMSRYSDSKYLRQEKGVITLKYDVCVGKHVKGVHQHMMKSYFRRPEGIPDKKMFQYPIWSTWAQYKAAINQSSVLQFATDIIASGLSHSHIEIDDKWSTAYGDLAFDPVKFPDALGMIKELRSNGLRITMWTTPFANTNSEVLSKSLDYGWMSKEAKLLGSAKLRSYFIHDRTNDTPSLTRWWNGYAGIYDFTNAEAAEWFAGKHFSMMEKYQIDHFKFDAGEGGYVPFDSFTKIPLIDPNMYARYYAESVAKPGTLIEFRSAYRMQHLPIFFRMMDKDSNWGFDNGLKTMIPTCLSLGILGYPFILPDMIGGNAYGDQAPDEELYIRWLEVTAFMPSMQFSETPWQYKSDFVMRVTKKYVDIHAEYVTPLVLKYAELATKEHGSPIIRPLWWVSPHDETAQQIEDEFLIGDEVLVAPVLEKGVRKRKIYFPGEPGWKWKNELGGEVYDAGKWLQNFPVDLDEIAYFKAIKPK